MRNPFASSCCYLTEVKPGRDSFMSSRIRWLCQRCAHYSQQAIFAAHLEPNAMQACKVEVPVLSQNSQPPLAMSPKCPGPVSGKALNMWYLAMMPSGSYRHGPVPLDWIQVATLSCTVHPYVYLPICVGIIYKDVVYSAPLPMQSHTASQHTYICSLSTLVLRRDANCKQLAWSSTVNLNMPGHTVLQSCA